MARFAQYAMVAAEQALQDAGWAPKKEEELEATVCEVDFWASSQYLFQEA